MIYLSKSKLTMAEEKEKYNYSLIPTSKQFGKWSMTGKASYIGFIFTLLFGFISLMLFTIDFFSSKADNTEQLQGIETLKEQNTKLQEAVNLLNTQIQVLANSEGNNKNNLEYLQSLLNDDYINNLSLKKTGKTLNQWAELAPTIKEVSPFLLDKSNAAVLNFDFEEALVYINKAILTNPQLVDLYINRSNIHFLLGNYLKASEDIDFIISKEPNYFLGYYSKGVMHDGNKEYEESIKAYSQSIILNPTFSPAYINRGHAYLDLGQYFNALEDFSSIIKNDPIDFLAYLGKSSVYHSQGLYNKELIELNTAIKLNPNCSICFSNRAMVHLRNGNLKNALNDSNSAISISPSNFLFYYNRALVYEKMDSLDNAISDYNISISKYSKFPQAYNNRGICYHNKGEFHFALEDFNKAINLDSTLSKAYYNRGNSLSKLNQNREALKDYNKSIYLNPNV